MSMCKICLKGQDQHNKKLWSLHQSQICAFCSKGSSEHSWKLWQIHNLAVKNALRGTQQKLYPITIGFARTCIARVCNTRCDPPYEKELKPIYMGCTECGLFLGSREEDLADMLDGMCLKCFRELTDQTAYWFDMPPATKIIKNGVRIWQYRDSKGKLHKMYGNFTNLHKSN